MKLSTLSLIIFLNTIWLPLDAQMEDIIPLDAAVRKAVTDNYRFQISRLDPTIAESFLTSAESEFDWEIFAQTQIRESEQTVTFSQTTGTSSNTRDYLVGARKQFSPGTTVSAQTNLNRRESNAGVNTANLTQAADLSLSIRQPLLRGFGTEANLAEIHSREEGVIESKERLRQSLLDLITQVETSYWNVARLQENLELQESSLEVAEQLLEEASEKERVGMATRIEVLQARASRAEREESVIELRRALGEAQDNFFILLNVLPVESGLYDKAKVQELPEDISIDTTFREALDRARTISPSLNAQAAAINQLHYDKVSAKQTVRPNLDLTLAGGYSGLDDEDARDAYDQALNAAGTSWSVGLEFSMPWGFRDGEATLFRAKKRIRQEELRMAAIEQDLLQEVRTAWRNLESQSSRVDAAQISVELQEATFEQEKQKFQNGLSVFRDVLEVQRDLDQARIRLSQAKFDQLQAASELQRLDGTLLNKYELSLSEIE